MKRIVGFVFAGALAFACVSPAVSSATTMATCSGPVVYAVPAQKIYYVKGETNYGHVKGGEYMCQAAANAKGYHKQ